MKLETALEHCARITRAHSGTFYLGSRLLPPSQRRAVLAVYAVCRFGDDAVDETPIAADAWARLDGWWKHVRNAYAGTPDPQQPLEVALAWVLESHDVPIAAFQELRLGLNTDLGRPKLATMDDLMLYCSRVGGVIGWMIAPVVGYRGGDATLRDALALGQAMQLTNVLRDVGEDLRRGRLYLPADAMRRHGVSTSDLFGGRVTDAYVALLEELVATADGLYRQGWYSIPRLRGTAPLAVGTAALAYQKILTKLRRNGFDNLTRRAHLEPVERVALVPVTAVRVSGRRLRDAAARGAGRLGDPDRGAPSRSSCEESHPE